jgi:hypothetical protein
MTVPPTKRDVRIAYFITSYRPPEQLHRLISTLCHDQPEPSFLVHHDVFQSPLDVSLFSAMQNVHFMTSDHPIIWGDFSLEGVRWRAFRWIKENLDVDWVVLLSEQDYPIAPLGDLRARLGATAADAVISGEKIDQIEDRQLRREVTARYTFQYTTPPSLGFEQRLPAWWQDLSTAGRRKAFAVVNRWIPMVYIHTTPKELHSPSRIGLRASSTPFDAAFPCWFHDSWFALSRTAIEHVIDYVDSHPEFVNFYRRTMIPVESATGTILFNDPQLKIENERLTITIWLNSESGRPETIGMDNLQYLLSTGANFARKFDVGNTEVLDALDEVIF